MSTKVVQQSEGRDTTRSVLFLSPPVMFRSLERTIYSSHSVDQSITSSTWIRIHPLQISHRIPLECSALTLLNCIPGRNL